MSDRDAGLGSGGFGASATEISAATTMTRRDCMAISLGIKKTPVEKGFLLGMAGKPPGLSRLPKRDSHVAVLWS
ncbi:hypothetical protein XFEB_00228 [Xylella fastidiosa EB92.1]|nr:hypothetical protein XFEB_00228 [Xylella fastidiosa EB92.1]